MSIDVIFSESELFYGEKTYLTSLFSDVNPRTIDEASRERENGDLHNGTEQQSIKMEAVIGVNQREWKL